jgi:hypothetical protein
MAAKQSQTSTGLFWDSEEKKRLKKLNLHDSSCMSELTPMIFLGWHKSSPASDVLW